MAVSDSGLKFTNINRGNAAAGGFTIDFDPSIAILAGRYNTLGIEIQKFKTPLERSVKQVMIPSIATNFHKHGRPRWAELSEETIRVRNGDSRILNRTGQLLSVATSQSIWTITDKSATVRSLPGAEYGGIHQSGATLAARGGSALTLGGSGRWVKGKGGIKKFVPSSGTKKKSYGGSIPARPFLVIQPGDQEKIDEVFSKWLRQITNLAVNWR